MILCAGNNETFSFAFPIGVGLVESAINLTRLCLFDKPDFLLFIGSAGSYGKYKIFDIVESTSATNLEVSNLLNYSYTPIDNVISNNLQYFRNDTIVNSSNFITTNFNISQEYLKLGIAIENMEFFSLCKVAQSFNIPIAGIFVITNYTNQDAHKDFIKNHQEALKILINYLQEKKYINVSHETLKKV
jgi:nucleoside phosphorylase